MTCSDNRLIERIEAGEKDCFAHLIERYQVRIFNLMYRYSASVDEAAEMTQEVFCRAYEKLHRYQTRREGFFPWLYTLALNYARDWSRKQHTRRRAVNNEVWATSERANNSPEQNLENKRVLVILEQALHRLSEDRRELLILRYRHDCSIKELTHIFQISESAVKMRLQRTITELEHLMEEMTDGIA